MTSKKNAIITLKLLQVESNTKFATACTKLLTKRTTLKPETRSELKASSYMAITHTKTAGNDCC